MVCRAGIWLRMTFGDEYSIGTNNTSCKSVVRRDVSFICHRRRRLTIVGSAYNKPGLAGPPSRPGTTPPPPEIRARYDRFFLLSVCNGDCHERSVDESINYNGWAFAAPCAWIAITMIYNRRPPADKCRRSRPGGGGGGITAQKDRQAARTRAPGPREMTGRWYNDERRATAGKKELIQHCLAHATILTTARPAVSARLAVVTTEYFWLSARHSIV